MPRDANGNMTLPVGNPVVTDTLITSVWANTTLSDTANEITDSLSRSGKGGMLSSLGIVDGTKSSPGLNGAAEPTSGLYRAGDGDWRFSVLNTDVAQWTSAGQMVTATGASAARTLAAHFGDLIAVEQHENLVSGGDWAPAIEAAAARGVVVLAPKKTYQINRWVKIPSNSGIVSDGTGRIYMPASAFNNTTSGALTSNSVGIDVSGEISGGFTANEDIILSGFKLESEVSDGRYLNGIVARNVRRLVIDSVELFGFPVAKLIKLDSIVGGGIVRNCFLRDCTTNVDYSPQSVQMTGIDIDNDRVNGVASEGLIVTKNQIRDLTFGPVAIAAHSYQTDGINVSQESSVGHEIEGNVIINVGEGIDVFGQRCIISGNQLIRCYSQGVKLIHGASHNIVKGNFVLEPGRYGITCFSSSLANNVKGNQISGNTIKGVGKPGTWPGTTTVAVGSLGNAETFQPSDNVFRDNQVYDNAAMDYAVRKEIGGRDFFYNNWSEGSEKTAYSDVGSGIDATIENAKRTSIRVTLSTDQSIAGPAETVRFDTIQRDITGEYITGTWRFSSDSHRKVQVYTQVRFTGMNSGDLVTLIFRKNGSTFSRKEARSPANNDFMVNHTDVLEMVPTDIIDVFITHTSASARTISSVPSSTFFLIDEA